MTGCGVRIIKIFISGCNAFHPSYESAGQGR